MSADTSRGTLSGVSAYLLWGVLTAYWKLLDAFDAFELIGWRVVTAVVLLLALVAAQGKVRAVWGALRNPAMLWRVSVAAVLLAVNWTLYVWAVVNEHVIETALGYFIAPLLTSAESRNRFRRRFSCSDDRRLWSPAARGARNCGLVGYLWIAEETSGARPRRKSHCRDRRAHRASDGARRVELHARQRHSGHSNYW
jgi:hypothetical protein